MNISLIAVDADDTLWLDAVYFRVLREKLVQFGQSKNYSDEAVLQALKLNRHGKGPGESAYASSVFETAVAMGIEGADKRQLELAIDQFLTHPIELLPHVNESLLWMNEYRKILVTKGVIVEQRRKLEQSGLSHFFEHIEILEEKNVETIGGVFARFRVPMQPIIMIGNSLESDIIPAVLNGGLGIWINHVRNYYEAHGNLPLEACELDGWSAIYQVLSTKHLNGNCRID